MSDSTVPQTHLNTSLSRNPTDGSWFLRHSVDPSPATKTAEGLHIVASNSLPAGENPEEWPMTTIKFRPRDEAERILMPYQGSYDFLDEEMPIPAGSSITFEVRGCIDPTGKEKSWRLGFLVGATVPAKTFVNAPEILIDC